GDFNEDGRADLIIVIDGGASGGLYLMLGDGTGRFGAPELLFGRFGLRYAVIADFDDDGHLDLAVSGTQDLVTILMGDGTGRFSLPRDFLTTNVPNSLVAADLNGDGRLDLAMAASFNSIIILTGNGDGTFSAPRLIPLSTLMSSL